MSLATSPFVSSDCPGTKEAASSRSPCRARISVDMPKCPVRFISALGLAGEDPRCGAGHGAGVAPLPASGRYGDGASWAAADTGLDGAPPRGGSGGTPGQLGSDPGADLPG